LMRSGASNMEHAFTHARRHKAKTCKICGCTYVESASLEWFPCFSAAFCVTVQSLQHSKHDMRKQQAIFWSGGFESHVFINAYMRIICVYMCIRNTCLNTRTKSDNFCARVSCQCSMLCGHTCVRACALCVCVCVCVHRHIHMPLVLTHTHILTHTHTHTAISRNSKRRLSQGRRDRRVRRDTHRNRRFLPMGCRIRLSSLLPHIVSANVVNLRANYCFPYTCMQLSTSSGPHRKCQS
jgi:hypothetical protein